MTGQSHEERRAIERAATKLSRERRIEQARPGWWVFSFPPRNLRGAWSQVTATTEFLDPETGRPAIRLTVTDTATGARQEIQHPRGYPAWCCTPAEARQAGLTLPGGRA